MGDTTVKLLIYAHASLGGLALLAGTLAIIFKKGSGPHKKSGKVFYYSMLFSAMLAMFISVVPGHESPFLLAIGIFSTYFLIGGYRIINLKAGDSGFLVEKITAVVMLVAGVLMILLPIIMRGNINIVLTVFAITGGIFAIRDLILYRDPEQVFKNKLKLHLGKMMGGYIASATAFVVVNEILPGLFAWFAPGVIGSLYITYWMTKLNRKPKKTAA